jgi:hypothetical protein
MGLHGLLQGSLTRIGAEIAIVQSSFNTQDLSVKVCLTDFSESSKGKDLLCCAGSMRGSESLPHASFQNFVFVQPKQIDEGWPVFVCV